MVVDSASGPSSLVRALRASGRQYAVACGSFVALLSLFNNTPVHVASMRGAIAWGSLLLAVSAGIWFAERAWPPPPSEDDELEGEEGADAAEATGA